MVAMRLALWPALGFLSAPLGLRDLPRACCLRATRRHVSHLPSWQEYKDSWSEEFRIQFKRVRLRDGMAHELSKAEAKDWDLAILDAGHLVATQADKVQWQLRPPPALRVLYSSGLCNQEEYLRLLRRNVSRGEDRDTGDVTLASEEDPSIGAIAVLLLGPGRAAFGLLRGLDQHAKKQPPVGWELKEHKVVKTYAVRGKEKKGTGRFQLFEDAKKRGRGGRSEGAKLRRQNAVRFFEKVNAKFAEWGSALRSLQKERAMPASSTSGGSEGLARCWPPSVVFFAGDLRLRRMLLDCKNPRCPLPEDMKRWIKVPGPYSELDPTLEALQRVARFLCAGEVATVVQRDAEPEPAVDGGKVRHFW